MTETTIVHIDGAARGNPGPASFACVLNTPGQPVVEWSEALGTATNNVAEYTALVKALTRAKELHLSQLHIHSDSELLVKQMNGIYRVKNEELKCLYDAAQSLIDAFDKVEISHVRREQNKRADELCNITLDGNKPSRPTSSASSSAPKTPVTPVNDAAVREDAIICIDAAKQAWMAHTTQMSAEDLWEQLWSLLEEAKLLKKK